MPPVHRMSPIEQPRLALLSFAHPHAEEWVQAWHADPRACLVAVWDDDGARGRAAAGHHGADFEADLATLLARQDVDAVGICAENARHADLAERAMRAGKHVLCEKPMATTLADCDAMIAARDHSGCVYMQAFPQRHDPSNLKLKALLDEGRVGRVLNVRKRHGHGGLSNGWFDEPGARWFVQPDLAGGGALLDEGIHAADTLRWLFGEPRWVWATLQHTTAGLGVEDNALAVFELEGGVRATLETSWTWLSGGYTTEVYGSEGTILQQGNDCASTNGLSELSVRMLVHSRRQQVDGWYLDQDGATYFKDGQHREVARQFVRCLRDGTQPLVTAEDGRAALAMVLAAYASARSGQSVDLVAEVAA